METKEEIKNLLEKHSVMLFMKGSPDKPLCGFSARVVEILNSMNVQYGFFNVLSNEIIRSGIKEYSEWPTIPQLYVKGEFVGGCDIVQEQFANGDLEPLLSPFHSEPRS